MNSHENELYVRLKESIDESNQEGMISASEQEEKILKSLENNGLIIITNIDITMDGNIYHYEVV